MRFYKVIKKTATILMAVFFMTWKTKAKNSAAAGGAMCEVNYS